MKIIFVSKCGDGACTNADSEEFEKEEVAIQTEEDNGECLILKLVSQDSRKKNKNHLLGLVWKTPDIRNLKEFGFKTFSLKR